MFHKSLFSLLMAGLLLASCSMHMQVPPRLADSAPTIYEVKGRQGWRINQRISFGPYESGKVRRGWTTSYSFPFIVKFSGAKQKLSFDIADGQGNKAEVFCLGKIEQESIGLFGDAFDIMLKNEDVFSGTIVLNGGEAWDFIINNANGTQLFDAANGVLTNGSIRIELLEVRHNEKGGKMLAGNLGYEFVRYGESLAAVETINRGRVIMRPDLDGPTNTLLSAMASALMLRDQLETID